MIDKYVDHIYHPKYYISIEKLFQGKMKNQKNAKKEKIYSLYGENKIVEDQNLTKLLKISFELIKIQQKKKIEKMRN